MLDRTFEYNGFLLRMTYNHELNRYTGRIINYNIIIIDSDTKTKTNIFLGDTANEVLEMFHEFIDNL